MYKKTPGTTTPTQSLPDILFEDDGLLAFNKPANISLLADRSGSPCLWDLLRAHYGKLYLVHRLDKGTTGVLVVAKSQRVQSTLTRAFNQRQVSKHYIACVAGHFVGGATQSICLSLCKGRKSRYRVAGQRQFIRRQGHRYTVPQDRDGVDATTRARLLDHRGPDSILALQPLTGRSHQLRVHLSWLGHAITGDHLYGRQASPADDVSLHLHCHKLVLPDYPTLVAPPPAWYAAAV